MSKKINLYLLAYALHSLKRRGFKSFFTFVVLGLVIFLLSSMLFIAGSLKYELDLTLKDLPDVTLQALQAGRHKNISTKDLDLLLDINGVQSAIPRYWGYYYFANAGVNFSVVGVDIYDKAYSKLLKNVLETKEFKKDGMLVGKGVREVLDKNYYKEYFNFVKSDGSLKRVNVAGVFDAKSELESNDMIFMPISLVKELFDFAKDEATDIVLEVPNKTEIPNIIQKVKQIYPDSRVITKEDMKISYQNIFDYKSGVFLALFIVSIFTFFIIIYDRASGLSSNEKREIGILKAVGWKIDDILKEKFYEAFIISFFAFIFALMAAMFFVYVLQAPILKDIFTGYSVLKPAFNLPFYFNWQSVSIIFFLSVPIYIAALIVPSWRIASMDADEVMR
jgi:ABC-type lipoprotein release transport system permease subunit